MDLRRFVCPPARKVRSENHRERLESLWFKLASKMLFMHRGPFNLEMAILCEPATCPRPVDQIAKGGNQYGNWKKCLVCKTKLEYKKFGPDNPRPGPKKINKAAAAASSTPVETVERLQQTAGRLAKASKPQEFVTHQEMQELMRQQADHITSTLSGALVQLAQSQQVMRQMLTSQASSSQANNPPQQMPVVPRYDLTQDDEMFEEDGFVMQNPNDWDPCQR